MKIISVKSGQRKRIIRQFSNSLQSTYNFSAEPVAPGKNVSGIIEIRGSNWVFPKPPVRLDLKRDNKVKKGMWDTFYSVYVLPETDVKITLKASKYKWGWIYLIIVLIILALASSLILGSN